MIELATDLTKESYIFAINLFISRLGLSSKFLSDNGKNFIGARNDIIKVQEVIALEKNSNSIGSFLSQEMIECELIPPRSLHFGGLCDRSRFNHRIINQSPYQQQFPIHHKFPSPISPRSRFFTSRFNGSYSKGVKKCVHIPVMMLHGSVKANLLIF